MPGSFDFLHIKRHTAGSSNELSFDVLDAARTQLDGKSQKNARSAKTPGSSKGSYHGVAGTSTLSAVPEVERRKKLRRARAIRVRIISVLVIIAAIGALAFAGYSFYQSRLDFSDRYNSLVVRLSDIDEDLVKVDAVMANPLAADMVESRTQAKAKMDAIAQKLDAAAEETEKAIPFALGDRDTVALTQMANAIEGRKDMLAAARKTFDEAEKFDQELETARKAWNEVLAADQMAREATASANNAKTDESTEAAKQMTQNALDKFATARDTLEGVSLRHEKIDFKAQIEYLNKRIEALQYAVATGDALIAGDREAATANNDAYNEADAEAAAMAQDLPLLLDELVRTAFKDEIASSVKDYGDARASVSEADADVRAYLSV